MQRGAWFLCLIASSCTDVARTEHSEPPLCHAVGCDDGLALALHTPNDTWIAGSYRFDLGLTANHACSMDLPADLPSDPSVLAKPRCEPELTAGLMPEPRCQAESLGAAAADALCRPIAGHFVLRAFLLETPELVTVHAERDGRVILDRTIAPNYDEVAPDGPECGPICTRGELNLALKE